MYENSRFLKNRFTFFGVNTNLGQQWAPPAYYHLTPIVSKGKHCIIINFYYCHYNWYHYCIYYDMFIDTITFTKYISYVSEIAQVRYTLTWCLPFDSDGISSDLLYDWKSCLLCFINITAFLRQQCLVIHNHHDDAEQPALIK